MVISRAQTGKQVRNGPGKRKPRCTITLPKGTKARKHRNTSRSARGRGR